MQKEIFDFPKVNENFPDMDTYINEAKNPEKNYPYTPNQVIRYREHYGSFPFKLGPQKMQPHSIIYDFSKYMQKWVNMEQNFLPNIPYPVCVEAVKKLREYGINEKHHVLVPNCQYGLQVFTTASSGITTSGLCSSYVDFENCQILRTLSGFIHTHFNYSALAVDKPEVMVSEANPEGLFDAAIVNYYHPGLTLYQDLESLKKWVCKGGIIVITSKAGNMPATWTIKDGYSVVGYHKTNTQESHEILTLQML